MVNVILAVFFGWFIERAQMFITAPNLGAVYNGYGTIEGVNKRIIAAPMAYRVLLPWMIALYEKIFHAESTLEKRFVTYETLRLISTIYALWAVSVAWDIQTMILFGILLLATFKYDYWDWSYEVAGIALCLTGNLYLAIPAIILHGMSRETAPLGAVAFYFATGDIELSIILGVFSLAVLLVVRMIVGDRELYCKRFMIRENIQLVMEMFKYYPAYYAETIISVLITILVIISLVSMPVGWLIPITLLVSGWTMGKADESRVFTAALPWAAAWLSGVIF